MRVGYRLREVLLFQVVLFCCRLIVTRVADLWWGIGSRLQGYGGSGLQRVPTLFCGLRYVLRH